MWHYSRDTKANMIDNLCLQRKAKIKNQLRECNNTKFLYSYNRSVKKKYILYNYITLAFYRISKIFKKFV